MNNYLVPQTHKQIVKFFKTFQDKLMGDLLLGMYKCRITQGDDIMLAFENALHAGIGKPAIKRPAKRK